MRLQQNLAVLSRLEDMHYNKPPSPGHGIPFCSCNLAVTQTQRNQGFCSTVYCLTGACM